MLLMSLSRMGLGLRLPGRGTRTQGSARDAHRVRPVKIPASAPPKPLHPRRAVGWAGFEIAARQGFQLLVMLVLARLLVPEDFALFALMISFTSIGHILAESGMTSALVQKQVEDDSSRLSAGLHTLVAGLGCYLLLWAYADVIETWLFAPGLADFLRVVGIAIPLMALAAVPDAVLIVRLDFRSRFLAELSAALVATSATVGLAVYGAGAWSFAAYIVLAPLVRTTLVWRSAGWWPRGRPSWTALRRLLAFGANIMAASVIDAVMLRLQSVLLARFGDLRELGHYNLAQSLHLAPATFSSQLLYRLGLPLLARLRHEPDRLRAALDRLSKVSTLLLGVPMLAMALVAEPLLSLVFGSQWEPAAPILTVLAVATVLWPVSMLNMTLLNAVGRSDLFLRVEIGRKAIMLALVLAALPWGAVGLAWAVLVSVAVGSAVAMTAVGLVGGPGAFAQCRSLAPLALLMLASLAAGFLLLQWGWVIALVGYMLALGVLVLVFERRQIREIQLTVIETMREFRAVDSSGSGGGS